MPVTKLERQLIKDFNKQELITAAKQLGFKKIPEMTSIQWVRSINDDLDLNGVPSWKKCPQLLSEYLVAAEYYTADGKLIEEEVDHSADENTVAVSKPTEDGEDETKPECYGFVDDSDPACKKCKIRELCRVHQEQTRPECFGKSYDEHAPECAECIIAFMCKAQIVSN
jgi:hypothetical protein